MAAITHILEERRAGVLLHITSLPKGDLGEDAFRFVDFLAQTGATVWQTLPLNMPHGDGSPYQCLSAHAGNPALISLASLQTQGWLTQDDLNSLSSRDALIQIAFQNFKQLNHAEAQASFAAFCQTQSHWLDDFALFMLLRNQYQQDCWHDWPNPQKLREAEAIEEIKIDSTDEINLIKFTQYLFFDQWQKLKAYANSKNVALFGDIPIFVSYDSADVWAQPALFKLDKNLNMTVVAGVPPDYFSETGQRWGNPHYRWDVMKENGFQWWLDRMRTQNAMFDMVRIDHFRGLEAAWEIPAHEPTAIHGTWVKAPGEALLHAIVNQLPTVTLVAEDLGIITPEVDALRTTFNLPGMKILQFAFDGSPENPYLPAAIPENSVVYTGTHDNDTTLGWFTSLSDEQKQPFYRYMQSDWQLNADQVEMPKTLIDLALSSKACLAIIPMQDILRLGGECRMNIPGTTEKNWQWRFEWSQLTDDMVREFTSAVHDYQRHPSIEATL